MSAIARLYGFACIALLLLICTIAAALSDDFIEAVVGALLTGMAFANANQERRELRAGARMVINTSTRGREMDKSGSMIDASLRMLGLSGRDIVTGFEGMVSSVNFDAYGCVQALITPPAKDGKIGEAYWFDVKRVKLGGRVMPEPNFAGTKYGEENGANVLPGARSTPVPPNV